MGPGYAFNPRAPEARKLAMRQRLAWVFVALAVMLVVGFLVPLGLSLRSQAELRTLAGAQSDARGVATALASSARATSRNPGAIDV